MRIALLTSLFPSRERPHEGVFAQRRWGAMARRGHAVRVVHPLPWAPPLGPRSWRELRAMAEREERAGIAIERPRYVHLPRRALGNARAFASAGVARLEAGERFDVLVADYAWPAAAAADACAQRGWPLVISGRGSDVLAVAEIPSLRAELASALRTAGAWCAVSEHLVRAMDQLAGEQRGVLVANGVDGELFRPRDRAAARRELGLEREGQLVLVVGHLIERKDPLLALEVFERLGSHSADASQLVFIGRGPLEAALRARIERAGLEARVRLVGEAAPEQLALWYAAADALLLTSSREGRPNVVLEALSSGLPVLATDAGGTRELLESDARMLAISRDPHALAAQLAVLLAAGRETERLRALAERWSWDGACAALENLLERAVQARPAPLR